MTNNVNKPEKKTPMRKCLGCMQIFDKKKLIRVVRTPEEDICLDFKGKTSGRGAYICRNSDCFRKARKAKRFEKNLGCEIPDKIFDALEKELIDNG